MDAIRKHTARAVLSSGLLKLSAPVRVDGRRLDPTIAGLLKLGQVTNTPSFEKLGVEGARKAYLEFIRTFEAPAEFRGSEEDIARRESVPRHRIYRPHHATSPGFIVYLHGGAFVMGDLETHHHMCRALAERAQAIVVAADYRRPPEHEFPAAYDDCLALVDHVLQHGDELGGDANRVVVIGDSAGGNLTLGCAREFKRDLRAAIPIYPASDAMTETPSRKIFAEGFGLDRSLTSWAVRMYAPGVALDDPRLSPSHADDWKRCCHIHVVTAGFDPLRDEGLALIQKLGKARVSLSHREHVSLSHGFIHMTRIPTCAAATSEICDVASDWVNSQKK